MGDQSIHVTATTVRVPVCVGHSEAINVETERKLLEPNEARAVSGGYAGGDCSMTIRHRSSIPCRWRSPGRTRSTSAVFSEDESITNGLNLWVVADNLRKGAALNAVQIAEHLAQG